VKGSKNIYAIGDCATIDQIKLFEKWEVYFQKSDINNDNVIDLDEFKTLIKRKSKKYPALIEVRRQAPKYFNMADKNQNGTLDRDEFKELLKLLDHRLTRFPSTATVAIQQGRYLGAHLNHAREENEKDNDDSEDDLKFRYRHIGGYEYVGAESGFVERGSRGYSIITGMGAWWMWETIYYSKMISNRMRFSWLWDKLIYFFQVDSTRF